MKLGRLPRAYNPAVPHLSALKKLAKPIAIPEKINYADGMPDDLGVMLNDDLGDCTCAAYFHALQVWSHHTNKTHGMITEPDKDVLKLYQEACGYSGTSETDQGGVEQGVLSYLLNTGAPTGFNSETRHKLRSFVEVDVRNLHDVKQCIYETGCAYIGIEVPDNIMAEQIPDVWDVDKNSQIEGGHAIILTGYDKNGFDLISWGTKYRMSNKFFKAYCDEAYALCDIDWLLGTGKTLLGLPMAQLIEQVKYLKK